VSTTAAAQPQRRGTVLPQPMRVADLVAALGGELVGDGEVRIQRIAPLADADEQTVAFLASARYQAQLGQTQAACVIVAPAMREAAAQRPALIVTPDPYLYFARLTQWWAARCRPSVPGGIHPSAAVAADVQVGPGVHIGAQAVVEAGAVLGEGAHIGALCHVGAGVAVGANTRLAPNVVLMHGTRVGARCLLHSGVVVGADGFGFAPSAAGWVKIEQLGGVWIGDDVEIGANTCIDRGALDDTVIGSGVKLDNLIQIAHNVQIGERTAMAGCAAVAGSTRIGSGCTIGGAANIVGHITIADGVHVSAASLVMSSLTKPGHYTGVYPLEEHADWEKNAATLRRLHGLRERMRNLEKKNRP